MFIILINRMPTIHISKYWLFYRKNYPTCPDESRSHLAFAFTGGGFIASNEESLGLSKPVVHFSFTYGVLRGLMHNFVTK